MALWCDVPIIIRLDDDHFGYAHDHSTIGCCNSESSDVVASPSLGGHTVTSVPSSGASTFSE